MPGHDDTLTAGGPEVDPMDELCTCGHTLGVHHTLDEACCEDGCECCAFQGVNAEFGNSEPSTETWRARLAALEEIQLDLDGGGETPSGEDLELLVEKHRALRTEPHGSSPGEMDAALDAAVEQFNADHGVDLLADTIRANIALGAYDKPTRNNTREAVDRPMTHDERSAQMDREPMSPTESMSADERRESDAVRSETLDNLCTCGHRYGDHWTDDSCAARDCVCEVFVALLKPVGMFRTTRCAGCGHDEADHEMHVSGDYRIACTCDGCECAAFIEYTSPGLDPKNLTFAHDENIGPHPEDVEAGIYAGLKRYRDEGAAQTDTLLPDSTSAIDHEKLERDRRQPYTPPILRKRFIGEDELRKLLTDAGRLDLLAQLPEVDRVTTNYDAEHWSEIERLARFPQGSSETTVSRERTTKAIATALLELRQCLGVTDYTERLVKHIEANAAVIHETAVLLDRITSRLPQTGEDT